MEEIKLDYQNLPAHVAIIMDGNGRWAKKRGLPRLAGHKAGMEALKKIVRKSGEIGIEQLTIYAFSTENWKRSAEEVSGIFQILVFYMERELKELHNNGVRVGILGDYHRLPQACVEAVERAMELTESNTGLTFNIALNYGGRADIVNAARRLGEEIGNGRLEPQDITEDLFSDFLSTAGGKDPDLVIRTSGELRLSNFLLWQTAYSELYFTDVLWPDFKEEDYLQAICEFQKRKRNFGGR